ncbi:MAG: hypothetical protein HFJ72_08450 [Adlercreutzia sp.]|nr:hypothetical protein [Adlercreutzia sp.]
MTKRTVPDNSGKTAPVRWVYEKDSYAEETEEYPTCSLCGSFSVENFCADCGARMDYGEEGKPFWCGPSLRV